MFKFTCAALTKTGKKPVNRDNYMVGNLYVPQDHADLRNNAQGKTEQPFFVAAADGMGDEASGEKVSAETAEVGNKGNGSNDSNDNENPKRYQKKVIIAVICALLLVIGILVCILSKTSKKQLNFHDAAFEKAIREALNLADDEMLTTDILRIKELDLSEKRLSDISDIESFKELTELYLNSNNISDISALANLTNLQTLYLSNNNISDVSLLGNLLGLRWLYLGKNKLAEQQVEELRRKLPQAQIILCE